MAATATNGTSNGSADGTNDYEVIIIGAGVAGIYQMYRLAERGVHATVLEMGSDLAAPGSGTATPAAASTRRATPTVTRSPTSCSRNGTGRNASLASREPALPQLRRRQVRLAQVHAVQLHRRVGPLRRRGGQVAPAPRRRPRPELSLPAHRSGPAVRAYLSPHRGRQLRRHRRVRGARRSTPTTGPPNQSRSRASGWPSSAPAPPACRQSPPSASRPST